MPHKLLLADDSVTIQRVIELTFAGEDVQVLTAGDGEQAIARIEADRPDIVLADIGMPKCSGYDVAAFVKERPEYSHIPVLLLTGAFEPVDEARAKAVQCDGVLVKPFEPQHVIARVKELLRGAAAARPGGSVARAVSDVPRPAERLSPHRPAEPPPAVRPAGDDALDDYFDRLDAAFATLSGPAAELPRGTVHHPEVMPRGEGPVREEDLDSFDRPSQTPPDTLASASAAPVAPPVRFEWPTVPAPVLMTPVPQPPPIEPAEAPTPLSGAPPGTITAAARPMGSAIADAFSALLAAEQGEPGAGPVRLTVASEPPAITEELLEEITRRVIERLGPAAVRDAVAGIVADTVKETSERLIREEIARLRKPKP